MSISEFSRSRMGKQFIDATMPKIADQLERMNTTLGSIAAALQALIITRPASSPGPGGGGGPIEATADGEATLARLVQEQLQIDTVESQGAEPRDFHEIAVSGLGVALRAAYRAGVAAALRQLRDATPAGTQPGA